MLAIRIEPSSREGSPLFIRRPLRLLPPTASTSNFLTVPRQMLSRAARSLTSKRNRHSNKVSSSSHEDGPSSNMDEEQQQVEGESGFFGKGVSKKLECLTIGA